MKKHKMKKTFLIIFLYSSSVLNSCVEPSSSFLIESIKINGVTIATEDTSRSIHSTIPTRPNITIYFNQSVDRNTINEDQIVLSLEKDLNQLIKYNFLYQNKDKSVTVSLDADEPDLEVGESYKLYMARNIVSTTNFSLPKSYSFSLTTESLSSAANLKVFYRGKEIFRDGSNLFRIDLNSEESLSDTLLSLSVSRNATVFYQNAPLTFTDNNYQGSFDFSSQNPISLKAVSENGETENLFRIQLDFIEFAPKSITSFSFDAQNNQGLTSLLTGKIDEEKREISITYPEGLNISNLKPTISHTGVRIFPPSLESQNFENNVIYRVFGSDGLTKDYIVIFKRNTP